MSSAKQSLIRQVSNCVLNHIFILIFFCVVCLIEISASEKCTYKSPCQCVFENGSMIDLTSLGYRNKARWENMKPNSIENYTYYYNPCFSFRLGPENSECDKGVAVCQVSTDKKNYFDCGDQNKIAFHFDNPTSTLHLIYRTSNQRTTNVTLICAEDAVDPRLEVKGENHGRSVYEMTLTSQCACPDLCLDHHLSAGSVLVIIFMIFVALYLILGIIHSSLTRGAHGWELIPHYEFWSDFPLLVRDGCVFVVSGCKPETAYERI